ncbi:hypothetical protein F5Y10DRAFT_290040 [Nemania abortiva]|nr:hypothetical protein F5Y10DRAFT_290040 [Nemania abortiva]
MGENPSPSETPQPTGIPRHAFLGVSITFLLLTAAFVAARLSVNIRNNKKIHFDDYIAAVAIVLFSATFGLDDELVKSFEKPTTTISELLKYGVAVDVLSGLSLATSKIPILFLYIRLFGVKRWLKILSYVLLFVLVVLIVVSIVAIAVVCAPHAEIEPQSHLLKCNNWSAHNGIATGIFSLVLDIIIFLLPIPIIINLRLPTSRKIGLAVVFASGLFAIGASAVSLRFKLNSLSGTSTDTSTAIFFT